MTIAAEASRVPDNMMRLSVTQVAMTTRGCHDKTMTSVPHKHCQQTQSAIKHCHHTDTEQCTDRGSKQQNGGDRVRNAEKCRCNRNTDTGVRVIRPGIDWTLLTTSSVAIDNLSTATLSAGPATRLFTWNDIFTGAARHTTH
jgi:hypothetical protein